MEPEAIGRMVRWARKRAGMTQAQLARACVVPQSTVARIERGTVVPRSATVVQLLRATGHELAVEPAIGTAADHEAIRDRLRLPIPLRTHQALGMTRGRKDPVRILRRLRRFGVRFVLIGELAESAHGAPGPVERTVEVCHALDPVNHDRLALSLADLGADPGAVHADRPQRQMIATAFGRLVLDPMPMADGDFTVLARNARRTLIYTGLLVPLAALDDLIRIRRGRDGLGDRAALDVLGAIRDQVDARNARRGTGAT